MPITPIHITINYVIYYLITIITQLEFTYKGLILIALAELIDLDHLFSKPIYKKNRNSFKTHLFHKYWKLTTLFAIILILISPLYFTGLAIISHLIIDYIHLKLFLECKI